MKTQTTHHLKARLQELRVFDEPEHDPGLVASSEALAVHGEDRGRLSHRTYVHHGLILRRYGGGVVEHQDLPLVDS